MEHGKAYELVISSDKFKTWDKNKKCYFTHFFSGLDGKGWEIGFYNPETDLITTFNAELEMKESEVFKEEGAVEELKLQEVKLEMDAAIDKAKKIQQQKYSAHNIVKGIAILQHIQKPLWNITFFTNMFAAINVKVDASSGEIISDSLTTFFDLRKSKE